MRGRTLGKKGYKGRNIISRCEGGMKGMEKTGKDNERWKEWYKIERR